MCEYQDLVLATYKEKKANGELSLLLSNATTAKLKKACLKNYDARYKPEDDDIFSDFFDLDKMGTDFRQRIRHADPGEFRPLLNHIKDETTSTQNKNSELLAWLIDFQPRPSIAYYKSLHNTSKEEEEEEEAISNNDNPSPDEDHEPAGPDENTDKAPDEDNIPTPPSPIDPRRRIAIVTLIVLITSSILFFSNNIIGTSYHEPLPNEQCMVWKGDRYEPIACDVNVGDKILLSINKEQLIHQRKITQPDTLTANSLGKVWYTKINGKPEFYTDSGMHPTDTLKRLKPLSNYILTKYVSYYRHLLKLLAWSIGIIIFFVICLVCITTIRKNRKRVSF